MFADDLIICGEADLNQANLISHILQTFCSQSDQTPSWAKSSILYSIVIHQQIKTQIQTIFPIQEFQPSTMHLGHPL
jgi:hypothetical protein